MMPSAYLTSARYSDNLSSNAVGMALRLLRRVLHRLHTCRHRSPLELRQSREIAYEASVYEHLLS